MTSSDVASVARRRAGGGDLSDTTAQHAAMFTWSKGHVTARDVVVRRLVEIPTIVRISTGYRRDRLPHKFNFDDGTLYLVRSARFQQLVVARTADKYYVTIPRDCPLAFRLLSNDDSPAYAALTLADILGGSEMDDVGPCNGQRVQISNTDVSEHGTRIPKETCGKLELLDIYKEAFLLCHAFIGGTLSSWLTVIPGYLPLKLNIAQSMTSGTDLGAYVSYLCQAADGYSMEYNFSDPQEIAVFKKSPNYHCEWDEPLPVSKPDLNPLSTFKPLELAHSKSLGYIHVTSNTTNLTRRGGGRLSLEDHIARRPLPPIPNQSEIAQLERNSSGLYRKYGNNQSDATKRYSLVNATNSRPLPRTGSQPNLLKEEQSHQKLSSAQSLEFLNVEDPPSEQHCSTSANSKLTPVKSFLSLPRRVRPSPAFVVPISNQEHCFPSDTRTVTSLDGKMATPSVPLRPPPPRKPSAEEIVDKFRAKSSRNSLLRRQRPVSPGMRQRSGSCQSSSQTEPAYSITERTADDTSATQLAAAGNQRLEVQRPPDIELYQPTALLPYNSKEPIYDTIASPLYTSMNRGSRTSAVSKTSQPSSANTNRDSSEVSDDGVYANAWEVEKPSSVLTTGGRPLVISKPLEKSSSKETSVVRDDDDDGYCMPQRLVLQDTDRGEGVGAEEDQNHYKIPLAMTGPSGGTQPSSPSQTLLSSPDSPDEIGYPSLDEVPTDISSLSVEDVLQCLRWLNLHKYVETFRTEQIDGELLTSVDQHVLIEELGFKRLDAIKLEKFARHGWRPKLARTSPNQQHLYYQQPQQQQQQQQQQQRVLYLQPEPLYTDV